MEAAAAPHVMQAQIWWFNQTYSGQWPLCGLSDTSLPQTLILRQCFCSGNAYQQAVMLAYKEAPDLVAAVESAWASWLKAQGRHGDVIQHYTAAGQLDAAVEAAGAARNWEAASGILKTMVWSRCE